MSINPLHEDQPLMDKAGKKTQTLSRRAMLRTTACSALVLAGGQRLSRAAAVGARLAYISTYTPAGPGITLWRVDAVSGAMEQLDAWQASNPSWIAIDRQQRCLYAVNEDAPAGGVSAYSIDRQSGRLTQISAVSSGGSAPCHLSIHPSGRYLLVANYLSGTIAVLPVGADGALGALIDLQGNPGAVAASRAQDSPPGQLALSDHSGSHMHMVQSDPVGGYVFAADAGRDQIVRWRLDVASGKLVTPIAVAADAEPGSAPRHFAFSADGRRLYNLQEQDGRVCVYSYDAASGALQVLQRESLFAPGFAGSFLGSELMIAPSGRHLYAAARLRDTITTFAIGRDGRLERMGETWTGSDYPRSFAIDPPGRFLFACNQKGDCVTSLRIDARSGALAATGRFAPIGSPVCMQFLS
jgi:6-phosphogluconolactonase